jgi:hypothetical protein
MSLIDQVLKPASFSWLQKKTRAEQPAEPVAPPAPSLASVEYELIQLRASLRGVVDFKDQRTAAEPIAQSVVSKPMPVRRLPVDNTSAVS